MSEYGSAYPTHNVFFYSKDRSVSTDRFVVQDFHGKVWVIVPAGGELDRTAENLANRISSLLNEGDL